MLLSLVADLYDIVKDNNTDTQYTTEMPIGFNIPDVNKADVVNDQDRYNHWCNIIELFRSGKVKYDSNSKCDTNRDSVDYYNDVSFTNVKAIKLLGYNFMGGGDILNLPDDDATDENKESSDSDSNSGTSTSSTESDVSKSEKSDNSDKEEKKRRSARISKLKTNNPPKKTNKKDNRNEPKKKKRRKNDEPDEIKMLYNDETCTNITELRGLQEGIKIHLESYFNPIFDKKDEI